MAILCDYTVSGLVSAAIRSACVSGSLVWSACTGKGSGYIPACLSGALYRSMVYPVSIQIYLLSGVYMVRALLIPGQAYIQANTRSVISETGTSVRGRDFPPPKIFVF